MNITAKELSGLHIGKTMTIPIGISGTISKIEQAETCTRVHIDPPTQGWVHTIVLNHNTPITIQEGQ